jgi:hypothetical protein
VAGRHPLAKARGRQHSEAPGRFDLWITGTLQSMTREQAKERLLALGAKVSASVSKSTSFVVVGAEPGSKAARARELGIPLVDEQGLYFARDKMKLLRISGKSWTAITSLTSIGRLSNAQAGV